MSKRCAGMWCNKPTISGSRFCVDHDKMNKQADRIQELCKETKELQRELDKERFHRANAEGALQVALETLKAKGDTP